ncbi:MAG: SusC/RagA family TonB-linked outer membrane protein [Saprospiraceae bacterium]
MKKTLLCISMLLSMLNLTAQKTITGTVKDNSTNEPLIGATVLVDGTTIGTATDIDGKYTLSVPSSASRLIISYVGYATNTVNITSQNKYDVSLAPGKELDEVIVIGYGTVKREDATGSLQVVNSEKFNKGAITAAPELLTGKVAGLQVSNSGEPGGGSVIRIRGGSSLSASNDPLIVIDGVPVANDRISGDRNVLNIVNPNDIASVTVLKDASATAIYGSRASNGVIIITTKKSNSATPKRLAVDYSGSFAVSNRANEIDVLNADEFRSFILAKYPESHPARKLLGSANTDWQSQIFHTGVTLDQNISLSGKMGIIPYRFSLGYTDRSGILKTDNFNRKTGSLNLSPHFMDGRLQINFNFKGMLINNVFGNGGAIGSATAFDPTQPILSPGNKFGGYFTYVNPDGNPNTLAPANPLALLNLRDNTSDVNRFISNIQIDYRFPFVKNLRANLNVAVDDSHGEGQIIVPTIAAFAYSDGGRNEIYDQDKTNKLLEVYLNYAPKLGRNTIDLLGGYSWQRFYKSEHFKASSFDGSKILTPENSNPAEYYLLSLFGRANVNIDDRLLLTFTLRRDGTSRFSPDNRWGLFPAAAAAYKLINKPTGLVSNVKLRLGYGVTGQQSISDGDYYNYLPRYLAGFTNAQYQFGDSFIQTLRPQGYDSNIKWEETTTYNVGLDFGILKDRITGTFDVYQRKTTDLLNFVPVPAGTNLTNFITTNVGDLENRGVEIGLNTIPYRKDKHELEFNINATVNKNKITKLTATDDPKYIGVFTGGISGGVGNTIQVHSVGYPANSFYVYEQVYDESRNPIEGVYVDRNKDGIVTPDDRYRYEKPAPDLTFGMSATYYADKFDISMGGRASFGNFVYNNIQSDQAFGNRLYGSTGILFNAVKDVRSLNMDVPQYYSDHFIQDGSFFRMDHITAGYNFDKVSFAKKLRVYLTAQNPFIFTKYKGLDPEVYNPGSPGVDGNIYPRSRTFLLGVNASF